MSQDTIYVVIVLIIGMVLHEVGHGLAAYALGDTTARDQGRLTLNPLKHIDPMGSVLLPLILAAGQLIATGQVQFLYGWAKPVPVSPGALHMGRYADPRRLMALVALAGPATNLALALLGGVLIDTPLPPDFVEAMIVVNLIIGLFNLLPVPPFDGGRIAVAVLPLKLARAWARMEKFGIAVVFLLLFVLPSVLGQAGVAFDPFGATIGRVLPWAETIVLTLTGHHVSDN